MDVRLILDPPAPGGTNMAIDEALLETASRGETVLRFYRWAPATLSLGYFQRYRDRAQHAASARLNVVRRATGGGAIVHDRELTYSFVTPISQRFSGNHQRLVRTFHQALCESLSNWQIEANLYSLSPAKSPRTSQSEQKSFLCFQRRAPDDVVCNAADLAGYPLAEAKIAGSAQRRRRNALLQHGSLLLEKSSHAPELPGIRDLAGPSAEAEALINIDAFIRSWAGGIAARLSANLVPAELTAEERETAENHRKTRYEAAAWQNRR